MIIRLTEKCNKDNEETQEGCIRSVHFRVGSGLRLTGRPGGRGLSKRWSQESRGILIASDKQRQHLKLLKSLLINQYKFVDILVCCDSVCLYIHIRYE